MDHFEFPRNEGRFESPDCVGVAGVPGLGRFVMLQLKFNNERVEDARFQSHGCGATIASASVATELVMGRKIRECRRLQASEILDALDGLPPDKTHCAAFVISALRDCLTGGLQTSGDAETDSIDRQAEQ